MADSGKGEDVKTDLSLVERIIEEGREEVNIN